MSDIDPELPDYLVDAILSGGPPPEAIDLVKNAFTWRTIDAELMELSYDSVLDDAGVRDASARRTLEFTLGDVSVIIEVDGLTVVGRTVPAGDTTAWLVVGGTAPVEAAVNGGGFRFDSPKAGAARIEIEMPAGRVVTPSFALG